MAMLVITKGHLFSTIDIGELFRVEIGYRWTPPFFFGGAQNPMEITAVWVFAVPPYAAAASATADATHGLLTFDK